MVDFIKPQERGYTVYSKSGCPSCVEAKILLEDETDLPTLIINCDQYLLNNRSEFLEFIKENTGKECKMFPIIFYDDVFIGGFKETWRFFQAKKAFE